MQLRDIFKTKIEERIEAVIKVGKRQDEVKLAAEIGSYVVTQTIERYLDDSLEHYTDTLLTQRVVEVLYLIGQQCMEAHLNFKGLLRETSIETLAHLGPRAFNEISGEVVNIVLFTLTNTVPKLSHKMTAFRLVGPKSPQEKDMLLKEAIFEQQEEVA